MFSSCGCSLTVDPQGSNLNVRGSSKVSSGGRPSVTGVKGVFGGPSVKFHLGLGPGYDVPAEMAATGR